MKLQNWVQSIYSVLVNINVNLHMIGPLVVLTLETIYFIEESVKTEWETFVSAKAEWPVGNLDEWGVLGTKGLWGTLTDQSVQLAIYQGTTQARYRKRFTLLPN